MAIKPEDWTAALIKGEIQFMNEWHAKEESESEERKRLRMIELTRLRVVVWGGWRPRTEEMDGWEDFEAKWSMVRLCKEVRELRIKKQREEDFEREVEEGRLYLLELEELYLLEELRIKKQQEEDFEREVEEGRLYLLELEELYLLEL